MRIPIAKETLARMTENMEFKRGYFLAVANLVRMYDASTIAGHVLGAYGQLDLAGIDEQDRRVLRPIIAELKRIHALGLCESRPSKNPSPAN